MDGFFTKQQGIFQWMKTAEGKKQIADAEKDAWAPYNKEFPNADKSKFVSQGEVASKGNVSAEIFFKKGPGYLQSVFGSDRKYWDADMKKALGLSDIGGFPHQLSPLRTKVSLPIPAESFEGKAPSLKKIFNADMKIYVTPDQYFTTKFREYSKKPSSGTRLQQNQNTGWEGQT